MIFLIITITCLSASLGNDMHEGKLTLPVLYALNATGDKRAAEWARKVKNGIAAADEIASLIEFTKQYGGIDYATKVMYDLKAKAVALIPTDAEEEIREALAASVLFEYRLIAETRRHRVL